MDNEEESESSVQSKVDLRKSKKPIMEKRRRARINQHLDELKNFILINEKDPTRHSKLEKADILEMTVKRLQTMQREQLNAANPAMLAKFRSGFSECASEVSRFVSGLEDVEPAFKQRLLSHLHKCVNQMMPYGHYMPYMPERHAYPEVKVGFHGVFQNGDENNNNGSARIQIPGGVQLIPHRLPSGELAFLVPQSAGISTSFPFFPPAAESSASCIGQSSAFTTVARRSDSSLSLASSSMSSSDESPHSEHPPATLSPNPQPQPRASQVKGLDASPAESSATSKSIYRSETQKPQIGDRCGSPGGEMPTRSEFRPSDKALRMDDKSVVEAASSKSYAAEDCASRGQHLRQPLSVITDQASNRIGQYDWSFDERKNFKKCHEDADEQLGNSSKRARYEGPGNSQPSDDAPNEQSIDNLAARACLPDSSTASEENSDRFRANAASRSFNANGDMWRPW